MGLGRINKWVLIMAVFAVIVWIVSQCGLSALRELTGLVDRSEGRTEMVVAQTPVPARVAMLDPSATLVPLSTAAPTAERVAAVEQSEVSMSELAVSGDGICNRTPEIQQWIVRELDIELCRLITDQELFRVTEVLIVPTEEKANGLKALIKPGDLRGLVSVKGIRIEDHCRDWSDLAWTQGVFEGFNPDADVDIRTAVDFGRYEDPTPDWTRDEVARGSTEEQVFRNRLNLVDRSLETDGTDLAVALLNLQEGPYGLTKEQAAAWRRQVGDIVADVRERAEDIGRAVAAARGDEDVVFGQPEWGIGKVGLSWQPAADGFGEVIARVELRPSSGMPGSCD